MEQNAEIDMLEGKRVLVTGGTGSLGRVLARRLLDGIAGDPAEVIVFSRSEATQHAMRLEFQRRDVATDEIAYDERRASKLSFRIGDVSNYASIAAALRGVDFVFHGAAMKQVPACEYHPVEAVRTNVDGAANIVRAIAENSLPVEAVVGIATDKACKPVNVMGMTKALQERIFCQANLDCPGTRFMIARYGNVIASRGSVIPLFADQIRRGGPLTVTTPEMTRFLMSLDRAAETVVAALAGGGPGEIFIPLLPAVRISDLAESMTAGTGVEISCVGVRPGEKIHEVLVSEEEAARTHRRGDHLVIAPVLPELRAAEIAGEPFSEREYSSADAVVSRDELDAMLDAHGLREIEPAAAPGAGTQDP